MPVMEMENVIAFKVRVQTLKEDILQYICLKKDCLLTPFVLMLFLGADGDHRPVPERYLLTDYLGTSRRIKAKTGV